MTKWAIPSQAVQQDDAQFELGEEQLTELKQMFILYDQDKNGVISLKELIEATKECGYDKQEMKEIFDVVDVDKDNVISFNELLQYFKDSYIN